MDSKNINNLAFFIRLIKSQLLLHNRVSLPGLGSFIIEELPSQLTDDGRLVTPPTRTVNFSVKETWNDEVLEHAYAAELDNAMLELDDEEGLLGDKSAGREHGASKLFLEQAKREVAQFVSAIESQLQSTDTFQFPGLGTMKMDGKRKGVTFQKSKECDLAPEEFGLTPLSVKPLPKPSTLVEPPVTKPKPPITKPAPPTKAKPPITVPEEEKVVEIDPEDDVEEVIEVKPPKIKPVKVKPEKVKKEPKVRKPREWKSQKKIPKWLYIALGILLTILILMLLAYIFRKELEPLWWILLYPGNLRP